VVLVVVSFWSKASCSLSLPAAALSSVLWLSGVVDFELPYAVFSGLQRWSWFSFLLLQVQVLAAMLGRGVVVLARRSLVFCFPLWLLLPRCVSLCSRVCLLHGGHFFLSDGGSDHGDLFSKCPPKALGDEVLPLCSYFSSPGLSGLVSFVIIGCIPFLLNEWQSSCPFLKKAS
jgi:hypothetical protein